MLFSFLGVISCILEVEPTQDEETLDPTISVLSIEEEERLGNEFHRQLLLDSINHPLIKITSPDIAHDFSFLRVYFKGLLYQIPSEHVVTYTRHSTLTFLDSDSAFAFYVPGAYYYISRGMLRSIENLSEFSGIMGSLTAHMAKHYFRWTMASSVLHDRLREAVEGTDEDLELFVSETFDIIAGNHISKRQVAEADLYGTMISVNYPSNPRGLASFLTRMKNADIGIINFNPDVEERITSINTYIAEHPEWEEFDTEELIGKEKWDLNTAALTQ